MTRLPPSLLDLTAEAEGHSSLRTRTLLTRGFRWSKPFNGHP